ncbi:MAG TPA: cytochrome c biogenesis protein CcdA, partial [Candidatus Limnocylindria bacterium]|nr:cytochrome c biogenesis protein CcdA [Candidatus Limnocylindria bacterium]
MRRVGVAAALVGLTVVASAAPPPADVVRAKLTAGGGRAVVEATIAPGWHVNAHQPRDEFLIPTTLTLTPPAGVRAGEIQYPPPVERRLKFGGDTTLLLYDGTVRFTAALEGAPVPGGGPLRAALRFQACDDSRCLPPRTLELAAALDAPSPRGAADPPGAAPLPGAAPPGGAEGQVAGWIARWGWPLTFLWIALVGVALNLTPCVYPLISVTVAFFGGRTGAGEAHTVRRALLYVLGICLTFSTLGATAALTGSLFGSALQRPPVLAAIALVLVALAGSNFGFYQLRVPSPVLQRLGRAGEGDLGAFFMGLTMGVVAAPCIGPAVLALLLFVAARQSVALGFALFFALGVGLGAPYLALAALARRLRALPRAGAWLAWVERVFGFLLLGLALYFVAPLLPDAWVRMTTIALLVAAG